MEQNKSVSYNKAPMLDIDSYVSSSFDGIDLNQNHLTEETLNSLYINKSIIWVTEVRSIPWSNNRKFANNKIYPCIIVKENNEYYLKDLCFENSKKYEFLTNMFPNYVFDIGFGTVKFKMEVWYFLLPEYVHASVSYEFINRYRRNIVDSVLIKL